MAKVCFIFSSPYLKTEGTFDSNLTIEKLKQILLKENWPESQTNKEKISFIRFFSMGKELYDHVKLSDIKLPDPNHPTPVLVHIVEGLPIPISSTRDDDFCSYCIIS